ncbi:uncharacterized protein LOC141857224 [Brevipalpus obovatus]|uniref:uncharacterized protein LOC141857224 n=1 Tax=Brevipalpus obovatus TaxID=246614 RepID=UPI003D9E1D7B
MSRKSISPSWIPVLLISIFVISCLLIKQASCSPVIEESDKRAGHNIMRFGRQAGHNIIRFGRAQGHNIMRFGKREESNNAPGSSYEGSMDYDPSYAMNYQASLPSSYGYYGSSPLDYPSSIRSQFLFYPAVHLLPYQTKKTPQENHFMRMG